MDVDLSLTAEARQTVLATCSTLCECLRAVGQVLSVGGYIMNSDLCKGFALVVEMSAELGTGSVELYKQQLWYAGSALVRQLIETEYLIWLFGQNKEEAVRWLNSKPDEIRRTFSPKNMRQKSGGRFRDEEYWAHCKRGGHPAPTGKILLKNYSNGLGGQEWLWIDLVQHLERIWNNLVKALRSQQWQDILAPALIDQAQQALRNLESIDKLTLIKNK